MFEPLSDLLDLISLTGILGGKFGLLVGIDRSTGGGTVLVATVVLAFETGVLAGLGEFEALGEFATSGGTAALDDPQPISTKDD